MERFYEPGIGGAKMRGGTNESGDCETICGDRLCNFLSHLLYSHTRHSKLSHTKLKAYFVEKNVSNQGNYSSHILKMIGQLIFNFSGYTKMRLPNLVEHDTLHEVNFNLQENYRIKLKTSNIGLDLF